MKKIILVILLFTYSGIYSQSIENNTEEIKEIANKYFYKKQYLKAIPLYKKVVEIAPDNPLSYFELIQCYYFSKQYKLCIENANIGLKLDPNETMYYFCRARANIKINNLSTVCDDLKKSIGLGDDLMLKYCK